jgi:hypothetical protein
MSIISDVFGAGGIASLAQTIIERFVPDPAAKAQALQQLQANQLELVKMQDDLETKLNDVAGQNIRADASSGDKFTQRARPLFMYMVEAILGFNYIGVPIAQMFGSKVAPISLPADLLTLFGVCVTGYVFARTADKVSSLPGDSKVSILGMTIGNKS